MRPYALIAPTSALFAFALVGGCERGLPRPAFVQQKTEALTEVGYPAPPARVEFIPKQPNPTAVWLDGEWSWSGSKWSWSSGRWVVAPAGARFAPWTTVRDELGKVYFAGSSWRDASGSVIAAPTALAVARSSVGDIPSAAGDDEKTGKTREADAGAMSAASSATP